MIKSEYEKNQKMSDLKAKDKVAREIYSELPNEDTKLLKLFDFLVSVEKWQSFWLVKWIKRKELYQLEYMSYYEKWLYNRINSWGDCDVFCYRVLNPMVKNHTQLYENVMKWTDSSKTYGRRAAPVSLLKSSRSIKVNYSFNKVIRVVDKLKNDKEIHVQKGVGWLFKYTCLSYPDKVYGYLKENVDNLPRLIFRYALEKAPEDKRKNLLIYNSRREIMDNSFEGLLEEWQYVRGLTKCFIKKLSNDDLDKKLPRNNLDTIRKQCEELLEVQSCYIEALDTKIIKFEGYKDAELPGNTPKNNLLAKCDELDSLLINKIKELQEDETITWFGEEKAVCSHLAAMISHESMHLGQIVGFCYATDIEIPEEIIKNMSLSS